MKEFLEWLDDKNLVIFVILVFGMGALLLSDDGALELIEKLAYGILGMAVGKGVGK